MLHKISLQRLRDSVSNLLPTVMKNMFLNFKDYVQSAGMKKTTVFRPTAHFKTKHALKIGEMNK